MILTSTGIAFNISN